MDSAPVSPERNTDFPASALVCPEDRQNIDELWKAFDEFYTENKGYIENAQSQNEMVPDIAPSKKSMQQEALKMSLLQNSRIILRGLQVLGQIHPAISVVITAFDAVIAIELNRRDNNAKAASVMTQMQNFMCALFQLRSLKSQELHPVASEELVKFMTRASEDIKACGSDIDYYLKKRLISRLVHAQFFQQRLAEHIATFAERRSELTLWLTGYTTGRVNEHIKITVRLEDKVDRIAEILHRYDSPQEKEALRFITEHAGFSNCLDPKNPRLFAELLERTGSVSEEEDSDEAKKQAKDNLRDQLLRELKEDIKDILSKNLPNFEALIRIQQNNFDHFAHLIQNQTSTIVKMSNHIMLAFPEGRKYVLITDPLLKKIWMEMGLRQSVKAEKFVLTFKDYYSREQSAQSPFLLVAPDSPVVALSAGSASLDRGFSRPITDSQVVTLGIDLSRDSAEDEQWALNYIDVVHLDPIVEAIDDDFSGFISILEANQFAIARPRSWSLLRWLAYWAAGWAVSIKKYKEKILQLVRQIYDSRQDVMACNMSYVDEYLDGYSFQSLDTLLRSTQPSVGESEETDAKLAAMVSDLDDGLEQRLLANLKSIKFNITSVDTVALITGPGRIERFVFPLIYLLLRHHLRIVKVASQRRLSTNYKMLYKMRYPSHSLQMVFEALRTRTAKLNAIFRRKPQDVQELFKKFSFGMMELFNSPKPYERKDSALLAPLLDASGYSNTMDDDAEALKIISEQLDHDGPDLEDEPDCVGQAVINDFSSTPLGTQSLCPTIGGAWTGLMRRPSSEDVLDESANDLVVFRFDTPSQEGSELTGEAESFLYGGVLVQGNVERKERPAMPGGEDASEEETSGVDIVALDFKVLHEEEPVYHFRVAPVGGHTFDWEGTWCYARPVDDQQAMPLQFKLTRSPPEAFPYRHILKLVTKEEGPVVEDATPADTNDQPALISVPATLVPTDDAVEIIALSTDAPTPFVEQPTEASDITPTPAVRPLTDGTVELQIEDPGSSVQPPKREIRTIPQARWAFAIEVVRYQVRQRLHSKSHYAEMASQRKRWIDISIKIDKEDNSDEEGAEFSILRSQIHPNIAYVWEGIATFYADRGVADSAASLCTCDFCKCRLYFVRYICITCCLESFNDQVDVCRHCLSDESTITTASNFTHRPSHTLLKTRKRILYMEVASVILKARLVSKRVKHAYRNRGAAQVAPTHGAYIGKLTSGQTAQKEVDVKPECVSCHREICLPCWVCTVCPQDTFICLECEKYNKHDESHHLLRIFDDVDVDTEAIGQTEKYIRETRTALSQEMKALEARMNERVDALCSQVANLTTHVEGVRGNVDDIKGAVAGYHPASASFVQQAAEGCESTGGTVARRLSDFEKEVNARFQSLESLLFRVLEAVEVRQ